ncbi:MAG: LptF/LptG family permease, partial [Alphaproteobacteria bacterium]
MILFRYNFMRFVSMFLRVAFIFACILLVIGMVDELGALKDGQGMGRAAYLAVIGQMENFYTIVPLLVLIAAISLFTGMSRSSEIIAIRAAGQSGLRFLFAPCLGAFLIGVMALLLLNPLVTVFATQYSIEKGKAEPSTVLTLGEQGLWMRQGDGSEQTIIFARSLDAQKLTLFDVTFLVFDPNGTPITRIESTEAALIDKEWVMGAGQKWDLRAPNPQIEKLKLIEGTRIATQITPKDLTSGFG